MNTPNIIDSLQSRNDRQIIISEIKNLVLEKLGNHTKETLGEDLNKKLSLQLNKDQINSIIQTQITDILTNSNSLKGKLEGLSAEEVEDIINDLEEQYLSKLYPDFSSMDDLKSDYDIVAELKLEQSVLQDNINSNTNSSLFIQKNISDLSENNSNNFIVSNSDLSPLNNVILSILNDEKVTHLLSLLESNNFDMENIESDDEYDKLFRDISKSEVIRSLIGKTRVSKIPTVLLAKKDLIQELINLTVYLSKNTDYDKNMKLLDFIEFSKDKEGKYQESLGKFEIELSEIQATIDNDEQRISEIESELQSNHNSIGATNVSNTQNTGVLVDELNALIVYIESTSGNKLKIDKGDFNSEMQDPNNHEGFHTMIASLLVETIRVSNPDTVINLLMKMEEYCNKDFIGGVLSIALPTFIADDLTLYFTIYMVTHKEYNYTLSTPISINSEDIPKIKKLSGYDDSFIKDEILSGRILIQYKRSSSQMSPKIDFGIQENPKRYKKIPSYLDLTTKEGKKAKFINVGFTEVKGKIKAIEHISVEGKNNLGLPITIYLHPEDVKRGAVLNKMLGDIQKSGYDFEPIVEEKTDKASYAFSIPNREQNYLSKEIYDRYSQDSSEESLPIMANDSVIGEAISQLNNAEAENQTELRMIVLKIRKYFSDLAEASLDKSLGRKMLGFEGARGMVGIILSNNVSLYKRYLELNKPGIMNKVQLQSEQAGKPVERILTDLLNNKKSVLEKRIFKLSLGRDYNLKQLENFDLDELIEYYNLTFVRHSIEDFEELMGIKLSTFDRKIAIKNPNSDPHVFEIENASKIKEFGKLYKIIESLGEEGIQIEEGYNIKTKSEHYICYVKEHNKFIISSDTVGSVFIFDGNAIDSVKEFGKKSLRELVKEKKGVEKKYNYADHEKSFRNIYNEIKKLDFGFSDEELETQSAINVAEQDKVLQLFCTLFREGLFEIKDVKSIPNFLSQWNTDINNIKSGKKASKYKLKIDELISQGYSIDELFMGFKKSSGITVCYSTDQLYYDLGGSIKQIRNYRGYSIYEKRYTDALVAYKLSGSTDGKAKDIIDSIENSILKHHTANQDNKNLIYLLSKYGEKNTINNLVTQYTTNPSVHNYNELKVKHGIQSIKSLLISMGKNNMNLKHNIISQDILNYQHKVAIQNSLYDLNTESLYPLLHQDFSSTIMARYFSSKNELLNFLGIDRDISSEKIQSELVMFNSVKHILEETIGTDEIDEIIQNLDKKDVNVKALLSVANKKSSTSIANKEIDEITNNKKLLSKSINISNLEALDTEASNKLNYLMGSNVINNISQPVIANYRKKYIVWKLIEKFYFAS